MGEVRKKKVANLFASGDKSEVLHHLLSAGGVEARGGLIEENQ